jgi:hypothetical protein
MMRMAAIVAMSCALAGSAAAQERRRAPCREAPAPFALSADNQIKGSALHDRLAGKTLVFTRPATGPRGGPGEMQFRIEFRGDGSTVLGCRRRRANESAWSPCQQFGPEGGQTGDRDVGVWRLEGDQLVLQRTRFGIEESRVTLHAAQGAALAVRRISGAPCMPGPVMLE